MKEVDMKANGNLLSSTTPITHERFGRGLAGASVLLTATLGWLHSPHWLWVTMGVALNLTFSALTDCCPVKSALMRMGMPGERDVGRAEAQHGRTDAADGRRSVPGRIGVDMRVSAAQKA